MKGSVQGWSHHLDYSLGSLKNTQMRQYYECNYSQWRILKWRANQKETVYVLYFCGLFHLNSERKHGCAYISETYVDFVLVSYLGSGGILPQHSRWARARKKMPCGLWGLLLSLLEVQVAVPPVSLATHSHCSYTRGVSVHSPPPRALRSKLFGMERDGHRCDHLLHEPFFSWASQKALHILKRRRKRQWPLVLLSTDTAGAGRGWRGVIFYRLATRRLLQWYTFFSRDCLSVDVPTRVPVLPANSLISKRGNILGQICFVKVENVPHHRWWP